MKTTTKEWNDFLLTTLKTISSGTDLEKKKAHIVLNDITSMSYDHEYEEIKIQVLMKERNEWYDRLVKVIAYDFKI